MKFVISVLNVVFEKVKGGVLPSASPIVYNQSHLRKIILHLAYSLKNSDGYKYKSICQIIRLLPRTLIKNLSTEFQVDKHSKHFTSWKHWVSMIFSQFSSCVSLREISNGLRSATGNLNHLGIEQRRRFRFKQPVKLLDSTTITLCLSLYDWAKYTYTKGAVKLHTLLDFKILLPEYVHISDGKGHDSKMAGPIPIPAGSIVVADRGYAETALLNSWDSKQVSLVVRHQKSLRYEVIHELDLPEHGHQQTLVNQKIRFSGAKAQEKYTKTLRHIAVYNEQHAILWNC